MQVDEDGAMMNEMNKVADPETILEQIRGMPADKRAYLEAQLAKDVEQDGRLLQGEDDSSFRAMIRERAQHVLDHPEQNIPAGEFFAWLDNLRAKARQR
jgi:hypothetical protein